MCTREYGTIYRESGFLAIVWFSSSPPPPLTPPPQSTSCLSFSVFLCVACRAYCRKGGEGVGVESKSYDCKKAWPSMNHSILSGVHHTHVICQQICDRKHCHPNPTHKKNMIHYKGQAFQKKGIYHKKKIKDSFSVLLILWICSYFELLSRQDTRRADVVKFIHVSDV